MGRRAIGKRVAEADGSFSVRGRNPNGTGSVYRDGKRYKATYLDPHTGKKRTTSGRTKDEASRRRDARVAELEATRPAGRLGPTPTISALVAWWLEDVAAVQVRPSSLHTYRKQGARITEHLGSIQVKDLDTEAVRSFLAALRRDDLAVSTVRNTRAMLSQIAAAGVELGYLAGNPVSAVPTPKATAEERTRKRYLTPDETKRLITALNGKGPLDPAVGLLFTSGLRVSEALGLAWSDLDLDAATATVRRACTYTGGGIGARLDRPKTDGTAGVHHLAPSVVALLKARKAEQAAQRLAAGPAWVETVYEGEALAMVFTGTDGRLVVRQHVAKAITAACERAGIDPTGVATHTGRRSTITNLFGANVPIDDVARHVGHASTATTAGYVVDLGERPQATARQAAELLDPAAGSA
ncbi:MAG: tyrosine-type recombinase/integrase [Solirubrobacterales bacterium]